MARTHSLHTVDAARVLGLQIASARRAQRWTIRELAERAGVSVPTVRKVERGELGVSIGTAFELATLLGVALFGVDREGMGELVERGRDRLALLPTRVRIGDRPVHDDF